MYRQQVTPSYGKLSRAAFLLFVLSVGIHKCNYLIQQLIGINLQQTAGVSLLLLPFLFLAISHYLSPQASLRVLRFKSSSRAALIFFYVHILVVYGFLAGNDPNIIIQEYWTAWIVLFAYCLSADEKIWQLFEGPLLWIFLLFALLVFLGTHYIQENLQSLMYHNNVIGRTTTTVAYNISPILDIWPFLFLLLFFKKNKNKKTVITYLPFIVYLYFQLFFLKRAPSVRAIMYLIVALLGYMYIYGDTRIFLKLFGIFALTVLVLFYFMPPDLIIRFKTEDHARQEEAINMFTQLSPLEHLVGKGLGGYYNLDRGGGIITINNKGQQGKYVTHIGAAYPYLKGGILFFLLVVTHVAQTIIYAFIHLKRLNRYQQASLLFLIVYSVFRLIEGPFSPGAIFDATLFGMSMGCLNIGKNMSRKHI